MPISVVIYNIAALSKYLPNSSHAWSSSVKTPSWWLWMLGKVLCGTSDMFSACFTLLWYLSTVWVLWPFRYFFYYRGTMFSADLVAADVFVLNMIQHFSLLVGWLFYLHIVTFGISKAVNKNTSLLVKYWPYITLGVGASSVICILRVIWFLLFIQDEDRRSEWGYLNDE